MCGKHENDNKTTRKQVIIGADVIILRKQFNLPSYTTDSPGQVDYTMLNVLRILILSMAMAVTALALTGEIQSCSG